MLAQLNQHDKQSKKTTGRTYDIATAVCCDFVLVYKVCVLLVLEARRVHGRCSYVSCWAE